jgi:hypothetical protein
VPTDGLVGWWPFNGNANDESGNGNNGTVNGATLTENRFGSANEALVFNGSSDNVSVPHSTSLAITGDITMCVWKKSFGHTGNYETFISKRNSNSQWNYSLGASHFFGPGGCPEEVNKYWTARRNNALEYDLKFTDYLVSSDLNVWTCVLLTIKEDSCKFYINGSEVGNSCFGNVFDAPMTDYGSPLTIGSSNVGLEFFSGIIDDIGIWNRALTPAEIQALYNAQDGPCVSPDPVSFTGLGSSYTLADAPVTLVGSPAGGVFLGPGVSGSTFDPAAAGVGTHSVTYTYVDGNNCINTAGLCTEVTINAGIGGNAMTTGGVRVFPNPNRGQFTVELELAGLVGLQVFDARGALLHNEVFTASGSRTQRTLDLSAFAKGSYTLLVEHDGQRVSQTVVVE